jgi:LuxR family quorum-sensing system transcriptional regulator SinR
MGHRQYLEPPEGPGRPKSRNVLDDAVIVQLETSPTREALEAILEWIRERCGLTGVVYFCASFLGCNLMNPFVVRTKGATWADAYKAMGSAKDDRLVQVAARSVLPIDWARIRRPPTSRPPTKSDVRTEHAVHVVEPGAGQGLTIPVRGPTNSIWAFLHVTAELPDPEWQAQRHDLIKELVHVAPHVHRCAYELHREEVPVDLNAITRREVEAIEYAAEGKSVEATAASMHISVETVKAHLDSARFKLRALNRVHAVTKAIRAGLIS